MAARTPIVAGNWKMNLDRAKAHVLAEAVAARRGEAAGVDLVLCPPSVYLETVASALKLVGGSSPTGVALGGQNACDKTSGAYTGEVAPPMLVDIGCRYVILGHSERRTLYGETDAIVSAKVGAALAAGLTPIVCVGELLSEREDGLTDAIVKDQVIAALEGLEKDQIRNVIFAYEPVWAIGTGETCEADEANRVIAMIRSVIDEKVGSGTAADITVLYGDPAWDARVSKETAPVYDQDLAIEDLPDGKVKFTLSITANEEISFSEKPNQNRPAMAVLPFRIVPDAAQAECPDGGRVTVVDDLLMFYPIQAVGEKLIENESRRITVTAERAPLLDEMPAFTDENSASDEADTQ